MTNNINPSFLVSLSLLEDRLKYTIIINNINQFHSNINLKDIFVIITPLIPKVIVKFQINLPSIPPKPISTDFFFMDFKIKVNSSTLVTNPIIINPKNASGICRISIIWPADKISNSPPIKIKTNAIDVKKIFFILEDFFRWCKIL